MTQDFVTRPGGETPSLEDAIGLHAAGAFDQARDIYKRILARALNYELADGSVTGPTIHMPALGIHDQAIMDSRHLDVIEMDAASHNGVDDIRQINDAVRYAPVAPVMIKLLQI